MLNNHLQSFARKDVAGIMQDYGEESVFVTPSGTLHGLAAIRQFFEAFIQALPANFFDSFKLNRQEVCAEVAYITWEAAPWIQLGTDSFLVRDEKILVQTFAAYPTFPSA
jgi:ketosteroid isomerase-like protein